MITLLSLLILSSHSQSLTCEEMYPEAFEYNCKRACIDGILVDCRRYPNEDNVLSVATVDLSKTNNIHSTQLITSDSSFITGYQVAHGAMELDTEIQALATAQYNEAVETEPGRFTIISKPEPRIVVKKGSVFQAYLPLTFKKDCDIVMGMTGALSQAQGMMLTGYQLLMNKCEVTTEKSFGHETFSGTFLVNALELESRKNLPKDVAPRGFFLGKPSDATLALDLHAYRPDGFTDETLAEMEKLGPAVTKLPVSSHNFVALQNKITFNIKDPSIVVNFPVIHTAFNEIASVQFKLFQNNYYDHETETPQGALFTFKNSKVIKKTPYLKITTKRFEIQQLDTKYPTVSINAVDELTYTTDPNQKPILVLIPGKSIKNPVRVYESAVHFSANQYLVRVKTKRESQTAYVMTENYSPADSLIDNEGHLSYRCLFGKITGLRDSTGNSIDKIKLPKLSIQKKLTTKNDLGKQITFCMPEKQIEGSMFEIESIK